MGLQASCCPVARFSVSISVSYIIYAFESYIYSCLSVREKENNSTVGFFTKMNNTRSLGLPISIKRFSRALYSIVCFSTSDSSTSECKSKSIDILCWSSFIRVSFGHSVLQSVQKNQSKCSA